MYIFTVLLSLLLFAGVSSAQQILQFDRESITLNQTPCQDGAGSARITVYNTTDKAQIFNLKFADAYAYAYFDSATVPVKTSRFIGDIQVGPHDSMWFKVVYAVNDGQSFDTIITQPLSSGTPDTLFLNITTAGIRLDNSMLMFDFQRVEIGDSAVMERSFTNIGEIPFIVKDIKGLDTYKWLISNIAIGDTIHPGETRTLRVKFRQRNEAGTVTGGVTILGQCWLVSAAFKANVLAPGLHWRVAEIHDSLTYCGSSSEYTVEMFNSAETAAQLDSIVLDDDDTDSWGFVNKPPTGVSVAPGETVQCRIFRSARSNSAVARLYTSGVSDGVSFFIYNQSPKPVLKNSTDTVVFTIAENQPMWFNTLIENKGIVPYRGHSLQVIGSPLWKIEFPDTTTQIIGLESIQIQASFEGTATPGIYKKTYTLNGTCEANITQTLIAIVGDVNDVEPANAIHIKVFPTVASQTMTIDAGSAFSYSVIDVLGNTVLSGRSVADSETIRVGHLPQGRYYARVECGGEVQTRSVVVVR